MKPTNKTSKRMSRLKGVIQKSFLVSSAILLVFVITQCRDVDDPVPAFPDIEEPELGGSDESFMTSIFKSVATGAAGNIGGTVAGWAMGALGISNTSSGPDYTDQLNKIDTDLQHISTQLSSIGDDLIDISDEIKKLNCSTWQSGLTHNSGIVTDLYSKYSTYVATASGPDSAEIDQATLSNWVDKVLGEGDYASYNDMGTLLDQIAATIYDGSNSGLLPSCIATIDLPTHGSIGGDTSYYKKVKKYTDYYTNLQIQGLVVLVEALHYRAWETAGSPNPDILAPDSASFVCKKAKVECSLAADAVNKVYNNLVRQLTVAGAPYTTDDLVMLYDSPDYIYLLPTSLEDFTTAAGDNCTYPLTSANPCGKTAGYYNSRNFRDVVYKGYTFWYNAGTGILKELLKDWKSGTAGDYLENRGFKNMKNKVILSGQSVKIDLNNSHADNTYNTQAFVPFFDTDLDYSFNGGLVYQDKQYDFLAPSKNSGWCWQDNDGTQGGTKYTYSHVTSVDKYKHTNYFYDLQAEIGWNSTDYGGYEICESFKWTKMPGWVAANRGNNAVQYRWPAVEAYHLDCTNGRDKTNPGSMWTMCGDDFTQWLEKQLPRPETCDNTNVGDPCIEII
mgnify:CR=1 FL=1